MKKLLLILIFLANLFLIFGFWINGSASLIHSGSQSGLFIALGRLTGLLSEFLILVELVLVSRFSWIEQLYGFDKLNHLHRWIGYSIAIFIISHPLFLSIGYGQSSGISAGAQFYQFLSSWNNVLEALLGVVFFAVIIIVSIHAVRKNLKYEIWHFVHLFVYVAILLALDHQMSSGDVSSGLGLYYWFALNYIVFGLLILFRFIKPVYLLFRHSFVVEKVVEESLDTYSIYVTGKNMENFNFKAGQYLNILFLSKGFLQTHPFSFSQAYNGKNFRITAKTLGDYTMKLKELKPGTKVMVDGPLGIFTEKESRTGKYLFIAGGIGVTPIRALTESLSAKQADVVFLYGARNIAGLAFDSDFKNYQIKYYPVISDENIPGYENGRIDEEKIKRLVPDFMDRDIYLCGPAPMMMGIVGILKNLGFKDEQLHYEKFSF